MLARRKAPLWGPGAAAEKVAHASGHKIAPNNNSRANAGRGKYFEDGIRWTRSAERSVEAQRLPGDDKIAPRGRRGDDPTHPDLVIETVQSRGPKKE